MAQKLTLLPQGEDDIGKFYLKVYMEQFQSTVHLMDSNISFENWFKKFRNSIFLEIKQIITHPIVKYIFYH